MTALRENVVKDAGGTVAGIARPAREAPVVIIEPSRLWTRGWLRDLWQYHELLLFLVWRDLKVRYKQTVLGATWAVLQPLLTMLLFTAIFGRLAKIPSDGLPYPVFAYAGLLPWQYFSGALSRAITSMVSSANLISKVYFPRLIVPLSALGAGLVDFAIAFSVLIGLMIWFGIAFRWTALTVPLFLLLASATALAVGLWLSMLNIKYRDVGHTIPFLIQFWMYASPVVYPASLVPERWRLIYSLNPMVGVIEGFRWALLGKQNPDFLLIATSTAAVFAALFGGILYFHQSEKTLADVI